MKIALGIFIGFFIGCVLFIVLAPDSVHEVIDRIHGNSSSNSGSSVVPQDDSGAGVIPFDEKPEPGDLGQGAILPPPTDKKHGYGVILPPPTDEPKQTKRQYSTFASERTKRKYRSSAPIEDASLPADQLKTVRGVDASLLIPTNESEMLDWLKVHNYTVAEGQGFYRIYWINLKPVSPKPSAIVVQGDGTVVPQYGNHSVASEGSIVSAGNNNISTAINSGITTTASSKYENGSWWIETIHSFVWDPSGDNINDVLSKTKKIKEMNDEN